MLFFLAAVANTVPPAAIDGMIVAATVSAFSTLLLFWLSASVSVSPLPMVEVSDSPAPLSDLPASLSFPIDFVRSSADFLTAISFSKDSFSSSSSILSSLSSASSLILGVPTPLRTSIDALREIVLADPGLLLPPDLEDPGLDDLAESGCKVAVPGLDTLAEAGLELGAVDFGETGCVLDSMGFLTDSTDPDLDCALSVLFSDSSDLLDLADWGLELALDLTLAVVPGRDSFTDSFSELFELADVDLELAWDSESYFGELALESFSDCESTPATSDDSFLDLDDVGLDSFSELAELSLDSFPEAGLESFLDL